MHIPQSPNLQLDVTALRTSLLLGRSRQHLRTGATSPFFCNGVSDAWVYDLAPNFHGDSHTQTPLFHKPSNSGPGEVAKPPRAPQASPPSPPTG